MPFRVNQSEEQADTFDEHPPLGRKLSKRGASLRLKCIGKQESDENPLMRRAIARNAIPSLAEPDSKPTNISTGEPLMAASLHSLHTGTTQSGCG